MKATRDTECAKLRKQKKQSTDHLERVEIARKINRICSKD